VTYVNSLFNFLLRSDISQSIFLNLSRDKICDTRRMSGSTRHGGGTRSQPLPDIPPLVDGRTVGRGVSNNFCYSK
jgi:hypothetical protein